THSPVMMSRMKCGPWAGNTITPNLIVRPSVFMTSKGHRSPAFICGNRVTRSSPTGEPRGKGSHVVVLLAEVRLVVLVQVGNLVVLEVGLDLGDVKLVDVGEHEAARLALHAVGHDNVLH